MNNEPTRMRSQVKSRVCPWPACVPANVWLSCPATDLGNCLSVCTLWWEMGPTSVCQSSGVVLGRREQGRTELVIFLTVSSAVEWPGEQSSYPQASSLCCPILPMLSQWPGSPMPPSLEEVFWGPMVQRGLELPFKKVFPSGFFYLNTSLFKESL